MRTRHQGSDVGLREKGRLLHVNCLGYKKKKKRMNVRPRPTIAVIEASRQIISVLCLTSHGRETLW